MQRYSRLGEGGGYNRTLSCKQRICGVYMSVVSALGSAGSAGSGGRVRKPNFIRKPMYSNRNSECTVSNAPREKSEQGLVSVISTLSDQ